MLVDERIIKSIPKVLVPASILNGFSKQRYNHVHRMIKHKCSISKNGEWSISKLVQNFKTEESQRKTFANFSNKQPETAREWQQTFAPESLKDDGQQKDSLAKELDQLKNARRLRRLN